MLGSVPVNIPVTLMEKPKRFLGSTESISLVAMKMRRFQAAELLLTSLSCTGWGWLGDTIPCWHPRLAGFELHMQQSRRCGPEGTQELGFSSASDSTEIISDKAPEVHRLGRCLKKWLLAFFTH